ncbi:MAG: alpha-L-glutamate ligase-like protein [Verrucomicrobiota bacterium JB025]|nr:alpha-L-glutamate ligase-like protein [Verrucomicrobiota bacterium JB025]
MKFISPVKSKPPLWRRCFRTPGELRRMGVAGINARNGDFVLPLNPRALYRLVDDKLETKRLAEVEGIAFPKTYAVVGSSHETSKLEKMLEGVTSFVIKPTRGSGGKGVLVIDGREGRSYVKPSGALVSGDEIRHHVSNILAGLFSLGGQRDKALVEYRVRPTGGLTALSHQGAPDIRTVLLHGYPVMAMLRAATRESDGRANLHQGALGIGIDLETGVTTRAIYHGKPVERHPDSGVDLIGVQIPAWDEVLDISVTCHEMTGLGYLGVDVMIDETLGPLMIEVNARPGLAIQLANGVGLLKRLGPIVRQYETDPGATPAEKIAFSKAEFGRR